jgi:hypothetical protein
MEVLQRTANRGSIATGYDIENSLKLERANSENLYRQIINGNRKTWTTSLWIKRTNVSASAYQMIINHGIYGNGTYLRFFSDDTLQTGIEYSSGIVNQTTSQVFRDTSAWMHIVWRVDTTQANGADRSRLYINGEQVTSFSLNETIPQNTDTFCNYDHGAYNDEQFGYKEASLFTSMYYADVYHVDGQSLAPTEFGEVDSASGIWKPIEADISSFGNNGYYLNFSNSSNLGEDTAGNGSFTLSNITAADQATDTPTNNFCTLNPIFTVNSTVGDLPISEGGTRTVNTASAYKFATSTIGVSSGKWYWEVNGTYVRTISLAGVTMPYYWLNGNIAFSGTVYYAQSGQRYNNSSASSFGPGWGDGDIIAFALDMDASTPTLNVYKNNTSLGDLFSGLSLTGSGATFLPPKEDGYFAKLVNYSTNTFDINFGGYTAASISSAASDENGYGNFEYAPPSGYYAICTKNLAEYG